MLLNADKEGKDKKEKKMNEKKWVSTVMILWIWRKVERKKETLMFFVFNFFEI